MLAEKMQKHAIIII